MKKVLFLIGCISFLFACTTELDTPIETDDEKAPVLYASIDDGAETKTYIDENYRVLWRADDRIAFFDRNTYNHEYRFDGNTGDDSGTFSIVPDDNTNQSGYGLDHRYAVYPYCATSDRPYDKIVVHFPEVQTYSPKSFGHDSNIMMAVSDGYDFQFKNVCGYLMIKLYGAGIRVKKVSIQTNSRKPIAGDAVVSMSPGGNPELGNWITNINQPTIDAIDLTCPETITLGSSADDYTEFWFTLPPVSLSDGFEVVVTDEDGKVFSKRYTSRLDIERSYVKKLAPIEVVAPVQRYLSFTALEDGTLALSNALPSLYSMKYSMDGATWTDWDGSVLNVLSGDTVYLKGEFYSYSGIRGFNSSSHSTSFVMTGRFTSAGSVMSLVDGDVVRSDVPIYCFNKLFENCTSLITPPDLPGTVLGSQCYSRMFYGCTNLIDAPVLPARAMNDGCYEYMFSGCTSLTVAPELPAQTLAYNCYEGMFKGCSNLEVAPVLPALDLEGFGPYAEMFRDCSKLNYVKALFTNFTSAFAVSQWLAGTASSGTFVRTDAEWSDWVTRFVEDNLPGGWRMIKESEEQ